MTFIKASKLILIFLLGFVLSSTGQDITTGIKLGDTVIPIGAFPTHSANYGIGGWQSNSNRALIPSYRLTAGTAVWDYNQNKLFIYGTNQDWVGYEDYLTNTLVSKDYLSSSLTDAIRWQDNQNSNIFWTANGGTNLTAYEISGAATNVFASYNLVTGDVWSAVSSLVNGKVSIESGTVSNLSAYGTLTLNGINVLTAETDLLALNALWAFAASNQVTKMWESSNVWWRFFPTGLVRYEPSGIFTNVSFYSFAQNVLVDGTVAMQADFNLGGFDITNLNTLFLDSGAVLGGLGGMITANGNPVLTNETDSIAIAMLESMQVDRIWDSVTNSVYWEYNGGTNISVYEIVPYYVWRIENTEENLPLPYPISPYSPYGEDKGWYAYFEDPYWVVLWWQDTMENIWIGYPLDAYSTFVMTNPRTFVDMTNIVVFTWNETNLIHSYNLVTGDVWQTVGSINLTLENTIAGVSDLSNHIQGLSSLVSTGRTTQVWNPTGDIFWSFSGYTNLSAYYSLETPTLLASYNLPTGNVWSSIEANQSNIDSLVQQSIITTGEIWSALNTKVSTNRTVSINSDIQSLDQDMQFFVPVNPDNLSEFTWSTNDVSATILSYSGFSTSLTVPEYINGKPVESIGYRSLFEKTNLSTVILPAYLKNIGEEAFMSSGVKSVIIPTGVTNIGDRAFSFCLLTNIYFTGQQKPVVGTDSLNSTGLESLVVINPVATGWSNVLDGIPVVRLPVYGNGANLTGITPDQIGAMCNAYTPAHYFTYVTNDYGISLTGVDTSLTEIRVPPYINCLPVVELGEWSFEQNESVLTVTIPDTVKNIAGYAFNGCVNLNNISIPDSVTNIGVYAFAQCDLDAVVLPESVKTINEESFIGCNSLTSVVFLGDAPYVDPYAFLLSPYVTGYYIYGKKGFESIGETFRYWRELYSPKLYGDGQFLTGINKLWESNNVWWSFNSNIVTRSEEVSKYWILTVTQDLYYAGTENRVHLPVGTYTIKKLAQPLPFSYYSEIDDTGAFLSLVINDDSGDNINIDLYWTAAEVTAQNNSTIKHFTIIPNDLEASGYATLDFIESVTNRVDFRFYDTNIVTTIMTNHVTRLWDTESPQYFWEVRDATNLFVLSSQDVTAWRLNGTTKVTAIPYPLAYYNGFDVDSNGFGVYPPIGDMVQVEYSKDRLTEVYTGFASTNAITVNMTNIFNGSMMTSLVYSTQEQLEEVDSWILNTVKALRSPFTENPRSLEYYDYGTGGLDATLVEKKPLDPYYPIRYVTFGLFCNGKTEVSVENGYIPFNLSLADIYKGAYGTGANDFDGTETISPLRVNTTYVGYRAGETAIGINNYAFGKEAGRENVVGTNNYAFGHDSGRTVQGTDNYTYGKEAGQNIIGVDNYVFGDDAGRSIIGTNNYAFGDNAGRNTRGNDSMYLDIIPSAPAVYEATNASFYLKGGATSHLFLGRPTGMLSLRAKTNEIYGLTISSSNIVANDFLITGVTGSPSAFYSIPSVYKNLSSATTTTVITANQNIYRISVGTASVISNNVSGLDLPYREASWQLWIDFTSASSLGSTFATNFYWGSDSPYLAVTGLHKFACSITDGITSRIWINQIQAPERIPVTAVPLTAFPTSPRLGMIFYNTTSNAFFGYRTNGWVKMSL